MHYINSGMPLKDKAFIVGEISRTLLILRGLNPDI